MGEIERKNRDKAKRKDLQILILEAAAAAGIVSASLLAPNVLLAMKRIGVLPNSRQKEYIASSASKLVKRGLIKYDGTSYKLTAAGQIELEKSELRSFRLVRPKRWDKKWRVIIFDIPEKRRRLRDQLRNFFYQAGLKRLQDSVWIYPYDCEDILTLLKTDLGIGKNVVYMIVDELEGDKHLREEFGLM